MKYTAQIDTHNWIYTYDAVGAWLMDNGIRYEHVSTEKDGDDNITFVFILEDIQPSDLTAFSIMFPHIVVHLFCNEH